MNKWESFSEVLGFLGVVAVPMVAGIFPILLLVASRRKGEYVPEFFLRFLAHPVVAGAIYLVSVGILFLHLEGDSEQMGLSLRDMRKEDIIADLDEVEQQKLKSSPQMPLIEVQFVAYPASKNNFKG